MKTNLFLIIALVLLTGSLSAQDNKASVSLTAAIYEEEVTGNLDKAVELYLNILKKYPDDRPVAAKTLYHLGLVNEKMGKQKAGEYFTRLVNTYPDQTEVVALAKARLAALSAGTPAKKSTEVAMRRIWDAGRDYPIGFSPDDQYVIYTAFDDNDLWLRDLQSGEKRRITREASSVDWTFPNGDAVISPDGKQIVYDWWVRSYGEVRLSALDGSSMKVIYSGQTGRNLYPSGWMPDGHQILAISYDRKDNNYRRHIISLPEGAIRDIGQSDPKSSDWGYPSRDGRYIVYGIEGVIFVYDTRTGHDSVLVKNPSINKMVGWTPDGSGILFVSDRSGTNDLYILRMENGLSRGNPEMLRRDIGSNKDLHLTRSGRLFRIDYMGTSNSFIVPVDEQSGKLTGTPTLMDTNYPEVLWPAWSPDGKLLYYTIYKGPLNDKSRVLLIRSEETGQTREINPKSALPFWYRPIMSPDGHQVAVTGTGDNMNFGVFAFNLESGDVSQLAKIPTENEPVDPSQNWSPDGKSIYFKVRSFEKSEEFIIRHKDLTTGEEKDVNRGIHTRDMKISPDGTRFVYFRNDKPTKSYVLGILDIQSRKELELWRVPEADSPDISGPTWAPDGKHVLVARSLKKGSELWRFPIIGGSGEKLHFFPEYCWGFVMHPSGKRMAFSEGRSNYELWELENFLPK